MASHSSEQQQSATHTHDEQSNRTGSVPPSVSSTLELPEKLPESQPAAQSSDNTANGLEKADDPVSSAPSQLARDHRESSEVEDVPKDDYRTSVTLLRLPNFYVRAFTPHAHTDEVDHDVHDTSFLEKIGWNSAEKKRMVDAETRLLPRVDIMNALGWQAIPIPLWFERLVVALFLGVALVVQAFSLFNYPAYTSDEGNYMTDAWAILQGKLTTYTFTYNHPPLGWILIAAWTSLTGGITSFGDAINSGRVLMLVLEAVSSLLLYLIARQLSGSRSAALLALVIYTLSPLSLLYRHEVLLDNIGTFWLLLSFWLIIAGKSRLGTVALAAVSLGAAILSKGVFLLFIPVMVYAVWLYATGFQRKFTLVAFAYISLALASTYVLFALMKGEFLPIGAAASYPTLMGTLMQTFQAPGPQAQFLQSWNSWVQADPILLIAGIVAMFVNILCGVFNRYQLLAALFAATFCLFLLISSAVYAFAIVPLLPLLALNIVLALTTLLRWILKRTSFDLGRVLLLFVLIGVLIPAGMQNAWSLVAKNQAEPQRQAMLWLRDNVSRSSMVVTDSYLYTDLHASGGMGVGGGAPFSHAQIYSDAALDPAIAVDELHENWQNVDFLVVDSNMLQDIQSDQRYFLLDQALHHAVLRVNFGSASNGTQIQIYQVIHIS
jgi:4-amino-4-deoxy-L-arabinose transferase and related glycosyltransferases of PMT family